MIVKTRRFGGLALALTLGLAAGAAEAQPPQARVITNPDWLRKPNGQDFEDAYPPAAELLGLSGRAVVSCVISREGLAQDCLIVAESPEGLGFDRAALKISQSFRFKPMTLDGRPVEGGAVRVPLMFQYPDEDDLGRGDRPPTASDHRMALARGLVDQMGGRSLLIQGLATALPYGAEERARIKPGPDHDILVEAMADMEAAVAAQAPMMADALIAEIATTYSEAQLEKAQVNSSRRSALFMSYLGRFAADDPPRFLGAELLQARAAARAAFCARRSCLVDMPARR